MGRKGAAGASDASTDMFLGHLCPIDEYRVYGYMTSTRLKLLAVLEDVNDIREPELKRVSMEGRGPRACVVLGLLVSTKFKRRCRVTPTPPPLELRCVV